MTRVIRREVREPSEVRVTLEADTAVEVWRRWPLAAARYASVPELRPAARLARRAARIADAVLFSRSAMWFWLGWLAASVIGGL